MTKTVTEREEILALIQKTRSAIVDGNEADIEVCSLTRREREVMKYVLCGKNNSEIADVLSISLNTVTRHMTHIFSKTQTNNRVELVVFALKYNLVS